MSFSLTFGRINVLTGTFSDIEVNEECDCHEAKQGCRPAFVFSLSGQVGFRSALHHLTDCRKQTCRGLKSQVFVSMHEKLDWLLEEETLLGCVHLQPMIYGRDKVRFKRTDFPQVAHHLATCPKDSCAQLRRSLLLAIRNELNA